MPIDTIGLAGNNAKGRLGKTQKTPGLRRVFRESAASAQGFRDAKWLMDISGGGLLKAAGSLGGKPRLQRWEEISQAAERMIWQGKGPAEAEIRHAVGLQTKYQTQ